MKFSSSPILIGALPSNQIVISGTGIDPIHALLEYLDHDKKWRISDLVSSYGIFVNNQKIEVEAFVAENSVIQIGTVEIKILTIIQKKKLSAEEKKPTEVTETRTGIVSRYRKKLFAEQQTHQPGHWLEVVAYWGDKILDVEHFHPEMKPYDTVIIGNSRDSHFVVPLSEKLNRHRFIRLQKRGCDIFLLPGMTAAVRKNGKMVASTDPVLHLGFHDLAHIVHDAIHYFVVYSNPPRIKLPREKLRDPLFATMLFAAMSLYIVVSSWVGLVTPKPELRKKEEVWASVVQLPKPVEIPKPKPIEVAKPEPKPVAKAEPKPEPKPTPKPEPKPVAKPEPAPAPTPAPARAPTPAPAPAKPAAAPAPNLGGLGLSAASKPVNAGLGLAASNLNKLNAAGMPTLGNLPVLSGNIGGDGKIVGLPNQAQTALGTQGVVGTQGVAGAKFAGAGSGPKIQVREDALDASGGLSQEEIIAVIQSNLNQIRHCYEVLLQRVPNAAGVVKVKFIVSLSGIVTSADIAESTINDSQLKSCVTQAVTRWKFPKPRGQNPVTVTYPFMFNPL